MCHNATKIHLVKYALFCSIVYKMIQKEPQMLVLSPCPVTTTLSVIGGKWKPVIMWILKDGKKRFGEIKGMIPSVTQKMLTQQLRELEDDGIIHRKVYAVVPPRVEYNLTEYGLTLLPVLKAMAEWGESHSYRPQRSCATDAVRV